jgi:hypothetical protein
MPTVAGGNRTNTRRMHMLREQFFQEGKRLDAKGDPAANCWLDGQPIDYDVEPGTTDASHNLDHYQSVKEHPELQEDPSNFRHSHKLCNGVRGADSPSLGLGEAVPDWW